MISWILTNYQIHLERFRIMLCDDKPIMELPAHMQEKRKPAKTFKESLAIWITQIPSIVSFTRHCCGIIRKECLIWKNHIKKKVLQRRSNIDSNL